MQFELLARPEKLSWQAQIREEGLPDGKPVGNIRRSEARLKATIVLLLTGTRNPEYRAHLPYHQLAHPAYRMAYFYSDESEMSY